MLRPLKSIEIALLNIPSVEDCYLLHRETSEKVFQTIVYVVSAGRFVPQDLHEVLSASFPKEELPHAYVAVTALPFTETGEVDEEVLKRIEVIDACLIQRCESILYSHFGNNQLIVVAHEKHQATPRLHLSEVLPEWKTQGNHVPKLSTSLGKNSQDREKKNL